MMKLLLVLAALAALQDDRSERIRRAIDWYTDPDVEVRAAGRKELLAIGPEAVPQLEKLLELRDALDIYRLLREMDKPPATVDARWVGESQLPSEEEMARDPGRSGKSEVEKYVWSRFREAYAAAKKGNYQRGYDIANALMLLEPGSEHSAKIRDLRKYCDNWITQTSILRSRVVAALPAGSAPGKHEFTLRMENVYKSAVRVLYDRGSQDAPTRPIVVVQINCVLLHPNGSSDESLGRTIDIPVEHEIPVAMGAQWERVFEVDTGVEFAEDQDYIRIYTVGAWTQPTKVEHNLGSIVKRIVFEPATFKVVPRKHAHMLTDPLAALEKAIAGGTVNEAFVAALLVSEEQKHLAVEKLTALVEQPPIPEARVWAAQILTSMTGQKFGVDPRRWRMYADLLTSKARK